jgi:hypothetical protein
MNNITYQTPSGKTININAVAHDVHTGQGNVVRYNLHAIVDNTDIGTVTLYDHPKHGMVLMSTSNNTMIYIAPESLADITALADACVDHNEHNADEVAGQQYHDTHDRVMALIRNGYVRRYNGQ